MLEEAARTNYNGFDIKAYDDLATWLVKHATWIFNRFLAAKTKRKVRWHYRGIGGNAKGLQFVGKLLWLVPIRPDLSYTSKELRRALQSPTLDATRS